MYDRPDARLLVAIHDVTPAFAAQLETLHHLLGTFGIRGCALLVVPNWHGAWPLEEYRGFTARLHEMVAAGSTVLLHGLRHDEVGQRRTLAHLARTLGRTDHEGEFASLGYEEAKRRIGQGLDTLRGAGLDPIGFVPPAWLAPHWLIRLTQDAGLRLMEHTRAVFVNGRRVAAPATCWSTRSAVRRVGSVIVAAARLRVERRRPLVRVALHTRDADWPGVLDSCRKTIAALLEQRAVIGYPDLLQETSSMSPLPSRARTTADVSAASSRSRPTL